MDSKKITFTINMDFKDGDILLPGALIPRKEKIPLLIDFNADMSHCVGFCSIDEEKEGVIKFSADAMINIDFEHCTFGPGFKVIKSDIDEKGNRIIKEAKLYCIGVSIKTPFDVNIKNNYQLSIMSYKKVILGAGKHQRQEGWFTLDQFAFEGIDYVHNLESELPFANNSILELSAVHVVEHLSSLVNFMNECHRVLIQGGSLYIETPEAGANNDLQFSDPTHVRCYRKHTFINYFTPAGIEAFGYTNKAWSILHIETKDGILIFHGQPIK